MNGTVNGTGVDSLARFQRTTGDPSGNPEADPDERAAEAQEANDEEDREDQQISQRERQEMDETNTSALNETINNRNPTLFAQQLAGQTMSLLKRSVSTSSSQTVLS